MPYPAARHIVISRTLADTTAPHPRAPPRRNLATPPGAGPCKSWSSWPTENRSGGEAAGRSQLLSLGLRAAPTTQQPAPGPSRPHRPPETQFPVVRFTCPAANIVAGVDRRRGSSHGGVAADRTRRKVGDALSFASNRHHSLSIGARSSPICSVEERQTVAGGCAGGDA